MTFSMYKNTSCFSTEKILNTTDDSYLIKAQSVEDLIPKLDFKHRRGFAGEAIIYKRP